ncbi:MAG: response regulator transcription factor [Acidimicrobiia bacterium]|nr:response regulator transcription factor [Acidimicrobiia bacterium]
MRVVVAEDDLLVRRGIVALLSTQDDIEVVATVADLDSLLAAVAEQHPDVVLTDIRMPPSHTDEGIRAAASIANRHPGVGVVVLSQYDDPEYAVGLLEDGSEGRGYLLKERVSNVAHLVEALDKVNRGGSYVDPRVIDRLVGANRSEPSAIKWLTPREREVLAEMARGSDNATIADTLSINIRSVEKHINSIFAKLGLTEESGISKRVAAVLSYLHATRDAPR